MATQKVAVHLDLLKNELQNAAIQVLASAPSSPATGQIYYNSTSSTLQVWSGGAWQTHILTSNIITSNVLTGASNSNVPSTTAIKDYVDNRIQGIRWGESVRVASTADVAISTGLENGDTLDGVTLATGDRVLLKNQSTATQNGIYVVVASGAASRSSETGAQLANTAFFVREGSTNGDQVWLITNDAITIGSTSITTAQIGGGSVPDASTTVKGKVELATTAEVEAKTDTLLAVTPSGLATFPRKYSATFTSQTSITVSAATHGLGATPNLQVQVYESGTPNREIIADVTAAASGDVTITFNASTSGHYVIIG